jgi:hypothetical protein
LFLSIRGDSLESCDGWEAFTSVPFPREYQPSILTKAVPGYWQQKNTSADNVVCPYIREQTDLLTGRFFSGYLCAFDWFPKLLTYLSIYTFTDEEIHIACKSTPKTPPKIIDLDIMEETVGIIRSHDYSARPLYHMHALQLMHLPMQVRLSFVLIFFRLATDPAVISVNHSQITPSHIKTVPKGV